MELLTAKQAAERLTLSARSVHDLVASGKLRAVRIGPGEGRVRFTPEDLEAYLQSCRKYGPGSRGMSRLAERSPRAKRRAS
jgi:excisionase family DNA binding protein